MSKIEDIARAICCAEDHEVCNEDIGVERDRIPMPCNWPLYREQARAAYLETLRQIRDNHSTEALMAFHRAYERALSPARWESPFSNGLEAFIDQLIAEAGSE